MHQGKFIVFEGGDKSGKSTQLKLLAGYLQEKKTPFLLTREPGGANSIIAEKIREIILEKTHLSMHPRTELLLYLASRAQHVEEIVKPALADGQIVICDRFDGSSYAYQGAARKLDLAQIKIMNDWAKDNLQPDLVIYLDITPEQAAVRKREDKKDRLDREAIDFHQKVREGYLEQAKENNNWLVIDGVGEINDIFNKIKSIVDSII